MNANKLALVTLAIAYYGMCYAAHVTMWEPIANVVNLISHLF